MNRTMFKFLTKLESATHETKLINAVRKGLAACMESEEHPLFATVENFPCWALCYAVYGEADGLDEEDITMVDNWLDENGYTRVVDADESTKNDFCTHPAFGKACDTETVTVELR